MGQRTRNRIIVQLLEKEKNREAGVYVLLNMSQHDEHLSISLFTSWFIFLVEHTT
jgi:hypothetical protein